ncbi:unnamed protein product [Rhizoctonia solani]|uniref:Uncharacterized protein n=1 Tax=Rhizoctonia solani TaxID=456999 RepID=A0A8H3ATP5_9AGAM|nr:unnamed protein product [Rhizoctonia solani]
MRGSHTSSLLHPAVERLRLHNWQAESKLGNKAAMDHQVLYIGGTRLPIPRSVSAPVMLSNLSIKTTKSGALAGQHVPPMYLRYMIWKPMSPVKKTSQ